MRRNPSRFALAAVSLLCIAVLAACNCAPTLRYVSVAPTSATIYNGPAGSTCAGGTQQYSATAYYSDGSQNDATSLVGWTSSNSALASIATGGLATAAGGAAGTVTITGSTGGIAGSGQLGVALLKSLAITPANSSIPVAIGSTQQFDLMGTFTNPDGSAGTQDLTTVAAWSVLNGVTSSDGTTNSNSVASIGTATGLLTAKAKGATTVFAALCGVNAKTFVSIGPPTAVALVVSPLTSTTPTVAVGGTLLFTAQEMYSDNSLHPISNPPVTWASATPATASINANTGVAKGLAAGGPVTITASETLATTEVITGTSTLTVSAAVARFIYVPNATDGTVSEYADNSGVLVPVGKFVTGGVQQLLIHPNGQFVYAIGSDAASTITTWDANSSTGALSSAAVGTVPSSSSAGTSRGIIDPSGTYLFTVNQASNEIRSFTINQATGALTQVSVTTSNSSAPSDIKVDPTTKYAYVINHGSSAVSGYNINANGVLVPFTTSATVPTTNAAFLAAIDPAGGYLYVPSGSSVDVYAVSATNGTLKAITGSPFSIAGSSALQSAAVDPGDKYLYTVDYGSPLGHVYSNSLSSGAIGAGIGSSVATGNAPTGIAIDPTGSLLVVANNVSNTLSTYSASSGTLAATGAFETGVTPQNAAFYVAPAAPTLAPAEIFATNTGSNTLAAFSAGSGGALTADPNSPFTDIKTASSVATSAGYGLIFTANGTGGQLGGYSFNSTATTTVTPLANSPVTVGGSPSSVVADLTGWYAYAANTTAGAIDAYTVNLTTKALVPLTGSPLTGLTGLNNIVIDQQGTLLFALQANTITPVVIGTPVALGGHGPGTLAAKTATAIAGNWSAGGVSADGRWLAVLDPTAKVVKTFAITPAASTPSATDGNLTPVATLSLTGNPSAITFDRQSRYLIITDATAGTVSAYSFSPTSTPQLVAVGTPITLPTGMGTASTPMFDATGGYLFVPLTGNATATPAVPGAVAVYTVSVSSSTPTFTAATGSPFAAGNATNGLGTSSVAVLNSVH